MAEGLGDQARDKAAADSYRRGTEAMEKSNWDYAVECFATCAKLKPDNAMFRQILRGAEYKKYDNNNTGAGTFAKAKLIGIRSRIKKAKGKEEWADADVAAEEGLKLNPWDANLNAELGEVAVAWGDDFIDIAKFAFMCARNAEPNSKDHNRRFAEILAAKMEFTEAAKVWRHICTLDPNDGEARSMATRMDFEETRNKGGYVDATSTQDVAVQRANVLGSGKKGPADAPGMSEEKDLLHAIRKSPDVVENYLRLVHYYRTNKQLEEAHEQLKTALDVSGGDRKVAELLEDVELDLLRVNLGLAKEAAAQNPEDESLQKAAKETDKELFKRELQMYQGRIETYPQDTALKLAYAERLMRIKKWSQAIPQLQKASKNVRLKGKAFFLLGVCFLRDDKAALARGQFDRALPEIDVDQDPKTFLECHYYAGRCCEVVGDKAAAEDHYSEVLSHDYDYKDALKRMENIQSGGE